MKDKLLSKYLKTEGKKNTEKADTSKKVRKIGTARQRVQDLYKTRIL